MSMEGKRVVETYRKSKLEIGDYRETNDSTQLLSIVGNPSENLKNYLNNKTGKLKITVVKIEEKDEEQVHERDILGKKYDANVTFDTVVVEVEGYIPDTKDQEPPIKINAALFEALPKLVN